MLFCLPRLPGIPASPGLRTSHFHISTSHTDDTFSWFVKVNIIALEFYERDFGMFCFGKIFAGWLSSDLMVDCLVSGFKYVLCLVSPDFCYSSNNIHKFWGFSKLFFDFFFIRQLSKSKNFEIDNFHHFITLGKQKLKTILRNVTFRY